MSAPLALLFVFLIGSHPPIALAQDAPEGPGAGEPQELREEGVPELVTDRPDVTESTSIVPRGWVQVEMGGLRSNEGETGKLELPGTLVRLGVVPRVEARLGWSGFQDEDPGGEGTAEGSTGAGDGEAAVKILLVERRGSRPDVALLPSISLPIGETPFTSGNADPGIKALASHDVSERLSWGANVGVSWESEPSSDEVSLSTALQAFPLGSSAALPPAEADSRSRVATWSFSMGVGLTERLGGFLEIFGEDPEDAPAAHAIDGGLTLRAAPHVQVDTSATVGLNSAADDWAVGAGVAFLVGL